jgi:hypothetical protein
MAEPPKLLADSSRLCISGTTRKSLEEPLQDLGRAVGFVRCLDTSGRLLWSDYLEAGANGTFPSSTVANAMAFSPDGLYVLGWTDGELHGCADAPCTTAGQLDGFIVKYASDGSGFRRAWSRQVGTSVNDSLAGASVEASGAIRAWGVSQAFLANDPWLDYTVTLHCFTADGEDCGSSTLSLGDTRPGSGAFTGDSFVLARTIDDPTDARWGVSVEVSGHALTAGIVVDALPTWSDRVPGATDAYGMVTDGDGVVVAGSAWTELTDLPAAGASDVFVRRYDGHGAPSWTLQFGTPQREVPYGVAVTRDRVYVSGQTNGGMEAGLPHYTSDADGFVAGLERPDSPRQAMNGLIREVEGLIADRTLKLGQGKSLIGKLELALYMLEWGNTKKAITMLEAFVHEVRAFRNAGILEPDEADPLITIAEAAIASLAG